MTKVVVVFFVGVVAGSIGMRLHAQRMENRESSVIVASSPSISASNPKTAVMRPLPTGTTPAAQAQSVRPALPSKAPQSDSLYDIPLTEAHEPLMGSTYDGRTLGEMHETLEQEPKQPWSYEKEQQLTEFFNPSDGDVVFDVHSIECRTTMCEIQAIALAPTAGNTVMEDLQRTPWWDFSRSFTEIGEHNGTTSVIMYLIRDG